MRYSEDRSYYAIGVANKNKCAEKDQKLILTTRSVAETEREGAAARRALKDVMQRNP